MNFPHRNRRTNNTGASAPVRRSDSRDIGHRTDELVLQTLRDLHGDGRDLRCRHMKERSQPLFFAAKELFGPYANAVRQAEYV